MWRLPDGSIVLDVDEARTVRAAMFGIDRFVQTDAAGEELRYVTGRTLDDIRAARVHLDVLREPEAAADAREALRGHLRALDAMADRELAEPRNRHRLLGVVTDAQAAGIEVTTRLSSLASTAE